MNSVRRNEACPCGSGKRYKHCHGSLSKSQGVVAADEFAILNTPKVDAGSFARGSDTSRQIVSAKLNDLRFVAVGCEIYCSDKFRCFHDFLSHYLRTELGANWGKAQVALPVHEQHPAAQWHTFVAHDLHLKTKDNRGLYSTSCGAAHAWARLAYDLYLVKHNAELSKRIKKRLRRTEGFQGARFEVAVAAMLLSAGFDLHFADEYGPGKHPEFYAVSRTNGQKLAVEAKSKHRKGIMGFGGPVASERPDFFGIDALLLSALNKDPDEPLIVFIELNTPILGSLSNADPIYKELSESWMRVQQAEWPRGFPSVGVVFYNDVAPWFLQEPLPKGASSIWAAVMWPEKSRHAFSSKTLLQQVWVGCQRRSSIPLAFPDDKAPMG